jgi:hypothetical protein
MLEADALDEVLDALAALTALGASGAGAAAFEEACEVASLTAFGFVEAFAPVSEAFAPVSEAFAPVSEAFAPVSEAFAPVSEAFGALVLGALAASGAGAADEALAPTST